METSTTSSALAVTTDISSNPVETATSSKASTPTSQVSENETCTEDTTHAVESIVCVHPTTSAAVSVVNTFHSNSPLSVEEVVAEASTSTLSNTDSTGICSTVAEVESKSEHGIENDPAEYAGYKLSAQTISTLIRLGPLQPSSEYVFPRVARRSFRHEWFYKLVSGDNQKQKRIWLTYSPSVNRAYCLPCLLFGGPQASVTWSSTGWNNYNDGIRGIEYHETTADHRAHEVDYYMWITGRSIKQVTSKNLNAVITQNRQVVSCVIDCVRYLASEMLAFRGHDPHTGKLISTFKLLSKYSPVAAGYLEKLDHIRRVGQGSDSKTKPSVNYLSPGNIRLLTNTVKALVVKKIVQEIAVHQKYSVIADGTYDSSKKEATVLLVRYIETNSDNTLQPAERLIDVFCAGETSGEKLCELVLDSLKVNGLDVQWLVGQGYDGAGNVRGKCQGLSTRIQAINSRAVYIWCCSHRLNLVVEATMACCADVRNVLGLLEELYTFFSGHKRNAVFVSAQNDQIHPKQLKRVTCTRWSSKREAVNTVLDCFDAVLDALYQLSQAPEDHSTVSAAHGLHVRLRDFRVLITLFVLREFFSVIGPITRQLQGISIDLAVASHLLQDCRDRFVEMRDENNVNEWWTKITSEAKEFAHRHNVNVEIMERRRLKKRMDGDESSDNTVSGEQRLFRDMFIPVLDHLCEQLNDRFGKNQLSLLHEISLFSPHSLKVKSTIESTDIECLASTYGLDAHMVIQEYKDFVSVYRHAVNDVGGSGTTNEGRESVSTNRPDSDEIDSVLSADRDNCSHVEYIEEEEDEIVVNDGNSFLAPLNLLQHLSGYPHLYRLYWTLVCLPVTSCSAERSLSKLKIIKNRLRSSLSDNWLSSLMVLASEKDLVEALTNDEIIDSYASTSNALRQQLLHT